MRTQSIHFVFERPGHEVVSIPLTPALSHGERGNPIASLERSLARFADPAVAFATKTGTIFPLPRGEGKGEGKGNVASPEVRTKDSAFTLIELILSIAIMAIVMIAINAVFFSAVRLRENTTEAVEESLPVQQALSTMRRDLQGAVAPSENGILTGDFKVGSVNSMGTSFPVDLELYTTTAVMRDNEPWGEVQRVTYGLRQSENRLAPGKDLIRSVTRNLLATMTPQPEDQWMMSGVESIEFSCYDGTQWRNDWDSTVTDTNLPNAIRVRILLASNNGNSGKSRPIEMVVAIDSQSRTNN
jgi:type II secretion system protein J